MFEQTVLMSTLEKGDPCAACVHAVRTAAAWILQQSLSLAPLPLRASVIYLPPDSEQAAQVA